MSPQIQRSLWVLVVTLATLVRPGLPTVFTSSLKVERMVKEEHEILKQFNSYIQVQSDRLRRYTEFYQDRLQTLKDRNVKELEDGLQHPNGMYIAIKQFASLYNDLLGNEQEIFRRTLKEFPHDFLAGKRDVQGALNSLLRLQTVYNLKSTDMAQGNYLGFQGPPLDAKDAFEIGRAAFSDGSLNESLSWLNISLEMYKRQNSLNETLGAVKALIARAHIYNGNVVEAEQYYKEALESGTTVGDVTELPQEFITLPRAWQTEDEEFANFSRLCSLEHTHVPWSPRDSWMVCRFREGFLPYYRFKEEILSVTPFVSLLYDVISDSEGDILKSTVKNKLMRGKVGGEKEIVSEVRTGDLAWLWDEESRTAQQLSQRVAQITRLNVAQEDDRPLSSEAFQVVNYGLGGHYAGHMDPFERASTHPNLVDSGERIATFLVYLSDVQRGGSTVFIKTGIAVVPVKNMALLWYNFTPAMEMDQLTFHAGCPVLIGQKWITNKWIWTYGNTFRRRCGLTPDATQLDIEDDMRRGYLDPSKMTR